VKKSRKIAEGLPGEAVTAETVIILDFEGMQCPHPFVFKALKKNWLHILANHPIIHPLFPPVCKRRTARPSIKPI